MPASLDCILCLMRQSLEAARMATDDESLHQRCLQQVMELSLREGFDRNPPLLAQKIHRTIREMTSNEDPYAAMKNRFNRFMVDQLDSLRARIESSPRPLETAVRVSIAGNMIDGALGSRLTDEVVRQTLEQAMVMPLIGDMDDFERWIGASETILFLADNAGEIACDRLLIEQLLPKKITLAVNGSPALNDATYQDAEAVGLTDLVEVIDNNNDGLGTLLPQCSETFLDHFHSADLIISKGLANFETLCEPGQHEANICYLFKAKCPFISRFAGVELGDIVLRLPEGSPIPSQS